MAGFKTRMIPTRATGFEDHLAGCDGCSEHVRQIRLTIGALSGLTQ